MSSLRISHPTRILDGSIQLDGSKSISNRVLIIRALCDQDFEIDHLSTSDDTRTLQRLLQSEDEILDAGHAGTTFRFLTAYLALQPGEQQLTGSQRMQQRPIGPLVDALRSIGANIEYLADDGYPPLLIKEAEQTRQSDIAIPGHISSQYISALLMIGPTLEHGLRLTIDGHLVSKPYVQMTLDIISHFGIEYNWSDPHTIHIHHQEYQARDFVVESDWSAASYYFTLAALADQANITLSSLSPISTQGDAVMMKFASNLGISAVLEGDQLQISSGDLRAIDFADYDLINAPDIAQSLSVLHAGLGTTVNFTGLETLKIKETDRVAALRTELGKLGVVFSQLPSRFSQKTKSVNYLQQGRADWSGDVAIDTYHDHRMAMAFAPLALINPVIINDPAVVTKSYPKFWDDLRSLGFVID